MTKRQATRGSISSGAASGLSWLLLLYQLPMKPSKLRVKIWRRLQKLGALQVRGSAYVLPNSAQAREDFEWIRAEVMAMKGEAVVFAAGEVDTWTRDEIIAGFQKVRAKDYQTLHKEIGKAVAAGKQRGEKGPRDPRLKSEAKSLRERLSELGGIDFFGAPGREEAWAALERLETAGRAAGQERERARERGGASMGEKYRNRVWVTRPRPGIDRMSSAWLIRRFIDAKARFAFADKAAGGGKGIPFDMYGAEFSHHGDACTFETLAERFGIKNRAVERIGQMVHDLDLKDDEFQIAEAATIQSVVEGLRQMYGDDEQLLEEGMKVFEALYRAMGQKDVEAQARRKRPQHMLSVRKGRR